MNVTYQQFVENFQQGKEIIEGSLKYMRIIGKCYNLDPKAHQELDTIKKNMERMNYLQVDKDKIERLYRFARMWESCRSFPYAHEAWEKFIAQSQKSIPVESDYMVIRNLLISVNALQNLKRLFASTLAQAYIQSLADDLKSLLDTCDEKTMLTLEVRQDFMIAAAFFTAFKDNALYESSDSNVGAIIDKIAKTIKYSFRSPLSLT